jgi:hypothetical protein
MSKNIFSVLILLILSVFAFSCFKKDEKKKNEHKIKSILISTYGGEMGYSQSLKVTSDSLYFDLSLAIDSVKKRNETKLNKFYPLENFIDSNELLSFYKISSGKSRLPIDGTDTAIIIETEKNKYSVINAENNSDWRRIQMKMADVIHKEFEEK